MTLAQQARIAGVRAQLAVRGLRLRLRSTGDEFSALIERFGSPTPPTQADSGAYQLGQSEKQADRLAILKDDLAGVTVEEDDLFDDMASSVSYRVVRVEQDPLDVLTRFTCETVHA